MKKLQQLGFAVAMVPVLALGLAGCGVNSSSLPVAAPASGAGLTGRVHGGQQPVVGSRIYLYAVSNTTGGAAASLLKAPGYVLTDANGSFSITGLYTCPAGAYVYLLALGGNPGLAAGTNNPKLAMAAGLGPCSVLTPTAFFTINEATTVAFTAAVASFATTETQVGSSDPIAIASAFNTMKALVDPTYGFALTGSPVTGLVPTTEINTLSNALATCVNSDGSSCPALLAAANVTSGPADTVQAALNIAKTPTLNAEPIFAQAAANGPFQPTLTAAPASFIVGTPAPLVPPAPPNPGPTPPGYVQPGFFNGQTALPNGVYYLTFPNGNIFGYFSYLSDPHYIYHFDLGYEYVFDANDGSGGVYFYDFKSSSFFYTSPTFSFPYLYSYAVNATVYYYPDPNNPGHYNTNGVRYFYNYATGQIITL